MNEKLVFMWVNLNEFIVYHPGRPTVLNNIVAIGRLDKNLIVIRPEYRFDRDRVVTAVHYVTMITGPINVLFGDSFTIDTWDHKIRNYKRTIHKSPEPTEEDRYIMEYVCPICGAEWEMAGSCACNDHCPGCDAEIEPMNVRDIV